MLLSLSRGQPRLIKQKQKKATTKLFALALVLAGTSGFSQTANEIAKSEHDLPDGKTDKTLMVFKTPKDVAGVGYLSFDYPDKPDGTPTDGDSWLYLPAMKK